MSKYTDKFKDPRWQKKRLEVLKENEFSCCKCGDDKSTLNVHHKLYKKGKDPWEYSIDELMVLCEECHGNIHKARERLDLILSEITDSYIIERIAGYAASIENDLFVNDFDNRQRIIGCSDYFRTKPIVINSLIKKTIEKYGNIPPILIPTEMYLQTEDNSL